MSLSLLVLATAVLLVAAYRSYGRFVARRFVLTPSTPTPAVVKSNDADFVPTPRFYLLGQHLSAIAAAGPIAGPILAGQLFGWLPAVLWIVLGVVLIGAVHDMSVLVASVRHGGRTIADVVRTHMGERAWIAFAAFVWVATVYVIVAFTDIVSQTFVTGDADMAGLPFRFNPGGAVALAATVYLALSVVMGLVVHFLRPPLWLTTAIFVPATLGCVWLGTEVSTLFVLDWASPTRVWAMLILGYCMLASVAPVWVLLQPRGYLGGFVLYLSLGAGVLGLVLGDFRIAGPAFTGFVQPGMTGLLFPFLFVTIACGACSGFHGLVCSGTTSRQVAAEPDCRVVGYGAMLIEAFIAILALSTVMIAAPGDLAGKAPGAIYGDGLGRFVAVLIGEEHLALAVTFGAMAFSTFVFDTIDVATRLGRHLLEEVFGLAGRRGAIVATAATCMVPALFLLASGPNAYVLFWTLFGTSNQLLAALSLLAVTVWLRRSEQRYAFTLLPMVFVLAATLTSLVLIIREAGVNWSLTTGLNAAVATLLLVLALGLLVAGLRKLRAGSDPVAVPRGPVPAG